MSGRHMCAAPLVMCAPRCLPPSASKSLAEGVYESVLRALLHHIRAQDDRQGTRREILTRAALSVRMGGLGLCDRSLVVPAAHEASWLASLLADDLAVPALRELLRVLSEAPVVPAEREPAVRAARPATANGEEGPSPERQGGTSSWRASAGAASADASLGLAPPVAATPLVAPSSASLAAFSADKGLCGPLMPRLQACLAVGDSIATPSTMGVPGGSPLESVSPQSTESLLPLPPPLYTANILAVGLPRALGGVPDTWRALLAVPARLTQRQLATAAHVAAARAMWAPLSICARARWAATGSQMEAAVRL